MHDTSISEIGDRGTEATFLARLRTTHDLPVLPQIHLKALQVASDNDSSAKQLQDILEHDPVLTTRILKLANSAYYGFRSRVESLRSALVLLGRNEVLHLIAASSVIPLFPFDPLPNGFEPEHFWYHSAAASAVAENLRKRLELDIAGEISTAGLLHDIGQILLATRFPLEFELCNRFSSEHKTQVHIAEQRILGLDHAAIGAELSGRWGLPASLTEVIRCHHDPEQAQGFRTEASLIYLANRIAHEFDPAEQGEERLSTGDLPIAEDPAWQTLSSRVWPADFSIEEQIEAMAEEVTKSDGFIRTLLNDM